MEAVTPRSGSGRAQHAFASQRHLGITKPLQSLGHDHGKRQGADHRPRPSVSSLDPLREVHQATAFGVDRSARCDEPLHGGVHGDVGGKRVGPQLWIAPAEIQRVKRVGEFAVIQRAKRHEIGSRRAQRVEVVFVIETKGAIPGDADANGAGDRHGCHGLGPPCHRACHVQHTVKVDILVDQIREMRHGLVRQHAFVGGDQSQVPFRNPKLFVARQVAERHGIARPFQRVLQETVMRRAADFVEDHARQMHRRIERGEAVHQRRRAPRHLRGVNDEQDRESKHPRHFRGAASA
jgi:hypothetical protein